MIELPDDIADLDEFDQDYLALQVAHQMLQLWAYHGGDTADLGWAMMQAMMQPERVVS